MASAVQLAEGVKEPSAPMCRVWSAWYARLPVGHLISTPYDSVSSSFNYKPVSCNLYSLRGNEIARRSRGVEVCVPSQQQGTVLYPLFTYVAIKALKPLTRCLARFPAVRIVVQVMSLVKGLAHLKDIHVRINCRCVLLSLPSVLRCRVICHISSLSDGRMEESACTVFIECKVRMAWAYIHIVHSREGTAGNQLQSIK